MLDRVVDQMVDIAVHHSMDGWLINIENKVAVSCHAFPLCHLLRLIELTLLFIDFCTLKLFALTLASQNEVVLDAQAQTSYN